VKQNIPEEVTIKRQKTKLGTCKFCGVEKKEFTKTTALDMHYVEDCVMLTQCPGCPQVVEISTLNDHLVD
jgi:late competence protein required for DNA uptake (superfamily II DNA/RNA helicase)